jgi:hypothetical protein
MDSWNYEGAVLDGRLASQMEFWPSQNGCQCITVDLSASHFFIERVSQN